MNQSSASDTRTAKNNVIEVTLADLPVHCPMGKGDLWNYHPRVYIPVEESGEASCPYCGTIYRLVDEKAG